MFVVCYEYVQISLVWRYRVLDSHSNQGTCNQIEARRANSVDSSFVYNENCTVTGYREQDQDSGFVDPLHTA